MDQSHQVWQSNGSAAANVVWLAESPSGARGIAGLPRRKQLALGRSWLLWLFLQAKYQLSR